MYKINEDTLNFIKVFGFQRLSLRTFSDRKKGFDGVVRDGEKVRCNICGEFKPEKDMYMGIKNKPICKQCSPVKLDITPDELETWIRLIGFKNNHCKHGVHISINEAHTDKDVKKVNAQFFEIDDLSMERQWEIIQKLNVEPSVIVKTRKSYHVYFIIKDGKLSRFREIQMRLAYTYGGDMQKRNESTCMRIPGFYHNKKDPIKVELVKCDPNLVYTQDEVIKGLSLLKLPEKPKVKTTINLSEYADELERMVRTHIGSYIEEDRREKFLIRCINPMHRDDNASAVYFKTSSWFYCSGCGHSMGIEEAAKTHGWNDILLYLESKRRNVS